MTQRKEQLIDRQRKVAKAARQVGRETDEEIRAALRGTGTGTVQS